MMSVSPPMPEQPNLVPLSEPHIPALITLFEQSVRQRGPEHYSEAQVEQWALGAQHPGFASQLRDHHGWVLEQGGAILGFVTLSDDGHLSLLYVSADHQRQGLGGRLLDTALNQAGQLGIKTLTTEASAFSYGLFLRYGFQLTGLESVERGGDGFIRYRLHWRLPS